MVTFNQYISPYSWRYGSSEMRHIWSEINKRKLWRHIWVCLATVQAQYKLATNEQIEDLEKHKVHIDLELAFKIEEEIRHDLMAELKVFASQCEVGGRIIHLGATSMDIEDNADAIRCRDSLRLVLIELKSLLYSLQKLIATYANTITIAFTHLQPAEPTTIGYRFALYAQDLLADYRKLNDLFANIRGKGFKGAVGNAASYCQLLGRREYQKFEDRLSELLDLPFYNVTSQTYPRRQDYELLCALAGLGSTIYKMAFDLRILQSPLIGEVSEPFGNSQVGSSAMPFKRNPINSEKINSLGRLLAQLPAVAWHNSAHSLLERTLDDSGNRRSILPEAFLIVDEIVTTQDKIFKNLVVNLDAVKQNLNKYAPFAATERILMELVKRGADRQLCHEKLREHSMKAWQAIQDNPNNPLLAMVCRDDDFRMFLSEAEIVMLFDINDYIGVASEKANMTSLEILQTLELNNSSL
jgi:adenylosuccinate lyase